MSGTAAGRGHGSGVCPNAYSSGADKAAAAGAHSGFGLLAGGDGGAVFLVAGGLGRTGAAVWGPVLPAGRRNLFLGHQSLDVEIWLSFGGSDHPIMGNFNTSVGGKRGFFKKN